MTVSDFSLKLLLLFLPGLVSFILINELSIHKETKNIHWFVYSILLGLFSYVILYIIGLCIKVEITFWSNLINDNKIINYNEIIVSTLIGCILGIAATIIINKGYFFKICSFIGITKKHGYSDTLSYFLGLYIMGPLSRPRSKILRVAVSRIILSSEASKVKLVGNLVA